MCLVQVARFGVAAAILAAVACGLSVSEPAVAAGPSTESIERQLAQQRVRLDGLYDEAASAAARFDEGRDRLAQAEQAVARERRAAQDANRRRSEQSRAVALLTVRQLQAGSDLQRFAAMLDSHGPQDLLARISAYDTAAEAMTAKVDELSGRSATHRATQRRLESARDEQRAAMARLETDRATINAAIARSKAETRAAEAKQTALLNQLAEKQGRTNQVEVPDAIDANTAPAQPPESGGVPAPPAGPPPTAPEEPSADSDAVWDRIAKCESGGRWDLNTGNGYYGGLQFSAKTWRGIGGPGLPHEHSREVQIHYAKLLQARYGWGQWSCAWARHGST
jgi:Transglycosylase-like domain